MHDPCVLVSGPALARDEALIAALQRIATVLRSTDPSECEKIFEGTSIDVLLLEIESPETFDLSLIAALERNSSDTSIIVIDGNGNRDLIAKAFAMGAVDAFPKPYNRALLVERVKALFPDP